MTTKPDFAQKLINDLRQRKQQIAGAQKSSNTSFVLADAYGSSRHVLKGSRETKRRQTVGPKIGSKYKNSSTRHDSPSGVQATNQIATYEGYHHFREKGDLSMALQYAFDDEGNLKNIAYSRHSKMIDFLQEIGRRSTNQLPSLTHFQVDEIAKGAQKLNQVLKACSNGVNIDRGTVEIGKELWQGAIELEHSLKMLISLQEASEDTVSPKRKSKVILLEEEEDGNDTKSSTQKQKKIERPVFSFDKASKNKGSAHTSLQPNIMALTYLKVEPDCEPEKQEYITPKGISHRRSASCGLEITSQHTTSSIQKHDTGIPNIIAKLMGLEELSNKVTSKVHTETGSSSNQKLIDMVSTRIANTISRAAEVKMEHGNRVQHNQDIEQSKMIALLKRHEPGLHHETLRPTHDHSQRARSYSHEPMWNGEAMRNSVTGPKAAISKIHELQSQIMQGKQNNSIQKDIRREKRFTATQKKQQKVNEDTKNFQHKVPERKQYSEAAVNVQAERLEKLNNHTEKRATNKSVLKTTEVKSKQLHSSQNVASHVTKLQSQQLTKHLISTKENSAEVKGLLGSKVLMSGTQTKEPTNNGKVTDSHPKQRSSLSLKSEEKSTSTEGLPGRNKTEVQTVSNTDTKHAHLPAKKVVDELKPQKMVSAQKGTTRTIEVINRSTKNARKAAGTLKPRMSNPEESHKRDSKFKPAHMTCDKVKLTDLESQQAEKEMVTVNDLIFIHDLQSQEETVELSPNEKAYNTKTSEDTDNQYKQEITPDEVQAVGPQSAATDTRTCSTDVSYILQPKQQQKRPWMEKPEPLTEDEVYLKMKLITSHVFLNTADALFKLNIPIVTLNYAIDQMCQEKDDRLILDCGYEVLKRKGRRKEIFLHTRINKFAGCKDVRSLDDLVRQLHKDFESLSSYGRNGTDEHDFAEHILRMLEIDIYYKEPDTNCMWDLGWNDMMFSNVEIDEVITEMEHKILDELMNEMTTDWMFGLNFAETRPRDTENCNH